MRLRILPPMPFQSYLNNLADPLTSAFFQI
jgi:hypothetical protein